VRAFPPLVLVLTVCPGCGTDLGMLQAAATTDVVFVGDFETGDLTGFNTSGNSPTVTTKPVHTGKYAMKTFLDRDASKVPYRTEVVPKNQTVLVGDECWYGVSILLPSDYVPDSIWEIVVQWHGRPDFDLGEDWRNPVMALYTTSGKWGMVNRWDAKPNTFQSGTKQYDGTKHWDFGPYTKQKWTDWIFHAKWSFKSGGLLEVWKDGKQVVKRAGPNAFNDAKGPYLKLGLYKGWKDPTVKGQVTKRTLFHDEVRIAKGPKATYNDVAPTKLMAPDAAKPSGLDAAGSDSAADLSPTIESTPVDDGSAADAVKSDSGSEADGFSTTNDVGADASRGEDGCSFSGSTGNPPGAPMLALSLLLLAAILRLRS